MKKYIIGVFLMSVLISLSVFYSCRKQTITDSGEITAKGGKLTIENARKIFEKQQSTTKSGSVEQELFDPGDYTMLWADAQWGMNDVIESVDVPINSNDKYFVWQRKVYAGDTVFARIPTTQRMVVFKNRSLDTTISYLLTLIPDGDYYIDNRTYDEHFLHGGDKGTYTGWAAYHTLGGEFVAAYGYDDGKCVKLRTFKTTYDDSLLLGTSLDIMHPEKVSVTKAFPDDPVEAKKVVCTYHKDCWVYPGAWDRPDHWNDPNANPNTGNNDYPGGSSGGGGGAGNTGDNTNIDKPLSSDIVNDLMNKIGTNANMDLTQFMKSPVTSSTTQYVNVNIRGITVNVRSISISGSYPNGGSCIMYMRPTHHTYPSFADGKGVTMHFTSTDGKANMTITMLESEYNKVF